ncbi:hypothetical protein O59_004023 [Cellvibrio sp. BR]|nr:hypothetical protein O59_004023 [Cellvibrio sp. BR]
MLALVATRATAYLILGELLTIGVSAVSPLQQTMLTIIETE